MAHILKATLITTTILTSFMTNACLTEVSNELRYELRSDRPLEVTLETTLEAGKKLLNDRGHELNSFKEDKLIYSAVGSFHSGWFNAAVAVNPRTCEIDYIGYFAAE